MSLIGEKLPSSDSRAFDRLKKQFGHHASNVWNRPPERLVLARADIGRRSQEGEILSQPDLSA